MTQVLKPGQKIRGDLSGEACEIEQLLGSGGQGEVYRVRLGGKPLALKWYYPHTATLPQRASLEALVKQGAPSNHFLWPIEMASAMGTPGFGYLMPLREARFRSIADLLKRRVDTSFRALATVGMNLAHAFLQLHARGLCYRDISHPNVFFEPKTGEILVCDNDNVAVDGQAEGGVLGTPRFMAPEIVRGEARPSTQTDLFSLAVLLFYLYFLHHPLEGQKEAAIRCFDEPAMTKLYGTEPVFIFDPKDQSNRPVPGYQDNPVKLWPIYPEAIRQLFVKAFTSGLRDPLNGRVRESEWRLALAQLRDQVVYCPGCARQNLADPQTGKQQLSCWSCKKPVPPTLRLRIGKQQVFLVADTELFPHHIDPQRLYDLSQPVAQIARHPQNPNVWGLKNLTRGAWTVGMADGKNGVVDPGQSVTLRPAVRIQFGKVEGEICIS